MYTNLIVGGIYNISRTLLSCSLICPSHKIFKLFVFPILWLWA